MGKVIFLDFEGPLLNVKNIGYVFDKEAVKEINDICSKTGAKIVCTSLDARVQSDQDRARAKDRFAHAGLDLGHIHEDWSCMYTMMKRKEAQIGIWLQNHPETTHFVVVDDLIMDYPNSVTAHRHWGLMPEQFRDIETHLTGAQNYVPPKSLAEKFHDLAAKKPVFRLLAGGKLVPKGKIP